MKINIPIRWIELKREKTKALLITETVIDWKCFDSSFELLENEKIVTWAESNIRSFLNTSFYRYAFSKEEKEFILRTEVMQESNPYFGIAGGRKTNDYLFILSASEVTDYLNENQTKSEMLIVDSFDGGTRIDRIHYNWWLRTPGIDPKKMCVVENDGTIDYKGIDMDMDEVGIRPALWIDFQKFEDSLVARYQK